MYLLKTSLRVKCSRCEKDAVIRVPYAKLNLCREHYVEYFEKRVLKTIERYKMFRDTKKALVALSGGKDSLTILHVLAKYRDIFRVQIAGIHLDLGIGTYSEESRKTVLKACRDHGIDCYVISLKDLLNYTLPELVEKTKRAPCSLCGLLKRYILNTAALEWGYDVVVTGHHMDDILVFRLKEILVGRRESEVLKLIPYVQSVQRLYAARARPLYETYEWEIKVYSEFSGIKHVEVTCPFKYRDLISINIAEMLEKIEKEVPGFEITLARRFARKTPRESNEVAIPCKHCEMPSSSGVCAICKLTMRTHGKPMGSAIRETLRNKSTTRLN